MQRRAALGGSRGPPALAGIFREPPSYEVPLARVGGREMERVGSGGVEGWEAGAGMPRRGAERGLGGVLIGGWSVETGTGGRAAGKG